MPPARKGAAARSSGVRARSGLSFADKICLAWFALDAFTHLIIEGSYVAIALGPTAHKSSSPFAAIWQAPSRPSIDPALRVRCTYDTRACPAAAGASTARRTCGGRCATPRSFRWSC